jgi:hypothetical protein
MPSTYTTNLVLQKPATGEQGGVWGNTANTSYDSIDEATDGSLTIALSASSYLLQTQTGFPSNGRNKVIIFNGTLTQNATVNIDPNTAQKIYFVTNATSGGFSIIFQGNGSSGSVFTLQNGRSAMIYMDGLGAAASVNGGNYNPQFGSVLITGALTAQGGVNFTQPATFASATFAGPTTLNGTTTVASLVIATGTPGNYDLYYRAPSGVVTPLAIGAVGSVLQVNSSGVPVWAAFGAVIGSVIPGSSPLGVYYAAPGSAGLSQDGNFTWNGTGLGIGLQAAHTLHVGGALNPGMWLDASAPASQVRQVVWATAGTPRWALASPVAAETGGNAGSNLGFVAYADNGAQLGWAMMFSRVNGHVSIGTSADGGSQLFVQNDAAAQVALVVRGASGQSQPLQTWQRSDGTVLASIDQNGVLTSAGGGGNYLSLNAQGRLDLGVGFNAAGNPLSTLHVGHDDTVFCNCAITMETAAGSTDSLPPNVVRMYYKSNQFVIQFQGGDGHQYFATLPLYSSQGGVANWYISPTPV